jgi:quercetin dioxygenase-like cupin family protein
MGAVVAAGFRSCGWLVAVMAAVSALAGDAAPAPPAPAVQTLMQRDLADLPGKEALMLTVEYPPAGASLPHRHNADVMVYVLEGQVIMQVAGQPVRTIGPGGTFYEGPADVHVRSANASQTAPAKFLVFMVKDRGQPVSLPAAAPAHGGQP